MWEPGISPFDIAAHLPEYELSYDSRDADDFCREYLFHHLDVRFDRGWLEHVTPCVDSEALLERLGAKKTDYGVISARGQSLYRLVAYENERIRELTVQSLTDEQLEVAEVLGQAGLFVNGRVIEKGFPEGLYRYELAVQFLAPRWRPA